MSTKKTRVRLTNEEKSAGMTVEDKKNGMTVSQKLKQNRSQEDLNVAYEENRPTGLGDVVAKVFNVTGVTKIVKAFTPEGEDCGCDARKKALNKLHLRGKQPLCLNLDEYEYLSELFDSNPRELSATQVLKVKTIYGRVFRVSVGAMGSCDGCVRDVVQELKQILTTYDKWGE